MLFELHITVEDRRYQFTRTLADHWRQDCGDIGVKPLCIELADPKAAHPYQLMTASTFNGSHSLALMRKNDLVSEIAKKRWEAVREKLEIPLDKAGAYQGEVDFAYHEAHVKCLSNDWQTKTNLELAKEHGWAASINILKLTDDGFRKMYFTKRRPGGWRYRDAGEFFAAELADTPFIGTARMEMETVLFDSNPNLDEGWV